MSLRGNHSPVNGCNVSMAYRRLGSSMLPNVRLRANRLVNKADSHANTKRITVQTLFLHTGSFANVNGVHDPAAAPLLVLTFR